MSIGKPAIFVLGLILGGCGVWWWNTKPSDLSKAVSDESMLSSAVHNKTSSVGDRIIGMGTVDVESGITPLTLPIPGTIMSIETKEGTRVAKGQPLIRLEDRRAKAQLTKAEIAVGEAKTRFIVAQKAQRLHDLTKRQQEWAISSARTAKAAAERNLASVRELAMTETLPESRLKDAQDRCDSLASALQVEELKLERLNLQDPTTEVAIAQSAVDAALADVECARQHLADHTMKAPTDGTVLRVLVNEGQFIGLNPLQAAIWFAPHQPTIIRAEVDQAFSSQLAVGMSAEFFDDNRRLSLGRGRIARISSWIAQRRSQLDEPFQRNDVRTLECIVEIDHATHELRLGERVRVDFFPAGTMTPDTPTVERLARNR